MTQPFAIKPEQVAVGWVLRDMMQSTGIWCFDESTVGGFAEQAAAVGFSHLEIGGGQSYQIALQNRVNPYQLLRSIKARLDKAGRTIPLQILLRGANQFGFHHFSHDVQRSNIDLLKEAGGDADKSRALIVRVFDALNDVENLRHCVEYIVASNAEAAANGGKQVHLQVALSYVAPATDQPDALYSVNYYCAYARALQDIAVAAGGSVDSICIKDMSGQLNARVASELVEALQEFELPVVLHCHSTDEAKSLAAILAAAEARVSAVEAAVQPLAGGASHHNVRNLQHAGSVQPLDEAALQSLEQACAEEFADRATSRKDFQLPIGSLKSLCALGIPGGAIPFIVHDLEQQVCGMLSIDLDAAIDAFSEELSRVQGLLGHVPLVTPTADIVAKQVIKNLGNQARAGKYKMMDPRFCSLVLGNYGEVINHATGEKVQVAGELVDEVVAYCRDIEPDFEGRRVKSGKVYPEPEVSTEHPSRRVRGETYRQSQEYVEELASRYPESVKRFGTHEECVMMQEMRPAGNDAERLLTRNILTPAEEGLRFLLETTLQLLLGGVVPEARDPSDDEITDITLLDLLGDYEGIVANIRDLVMHTDKEEVQNRLKGLMAEVVGAYTDKNPEARANRYYVERRFVAIFAAAVFWDLQRVCRRTGSDSRAGLAETTANSLGRIISVTLRKRKEAGAGKADRYLA